jgi:AcrR family transcriptional regulator
MHLVVGAPLGGRRQRRAAETRIRLFRAALGLIAERGIDKVTVEDITEAADVGKGTFFNYFPTKEHVLGVMAEIQFAKANEAAALALDGDRPIREVLHQLVLRLGEEPGRNPKLARAFISSFLACAAVRETIKSTMIEGRRVLAALVAQGQRRGEIDAALEAEKAAVALMRASMGTILFWSLHEEPSLSECLEATFQFVWRSMAATGKEGA